MTEIEKAISELVFEPIDYFNDRGNTISIVGTSYLGIAMREVIFYPFNIFKEPTYTYSCDMCLKLDVETYGLVKLTDYGYYCEDGYGYPESDKLENIIQFIKMNRNELN